MESASNRSVIVTGARGFIGRHMARILAQRGYRVAGIGHGAWQEEDWKHWGLKSWWESDITVKTLARCAEEPYAIIHFAGGSSVPISLANPLSDFERTVSTTANVLEFVRSCSPSTRVVYPSSASIYGDATSFPIPEDERPAPISPYGTHKWLAEQMVGLYSRQYNIPSAVVRLFSVYGCGLRKQLLWDACRKLSDGNASFMGTGAEIRDWLYVEDAARLLLLAIENAGSECPTVNGGTGLGVTVRELLNTLAQELPGKSEPEFSGTQRSGDPSCFVADITRATAWGWKPQRTLKDGLSEYALWWQLSNKPTEVRITEERHSLAMFS